jgi:hypothetical protein
MGRIVIEVFEWRLEAAYRGDPFHAVRRNLASVLPAEWDLRPATWSKEIFGEDPELSICDLAFHIGGPKYMYADRAFGNGSLEWGDIKPPASREMAIVLEWMDAGHQLLADGLKRLTDDDELSAQRQAPWRTPMSRMQLVALVINHDVYHSGEINRQRSLIRGAEGWERGK